MEFYQDWKELLALLNRHGVEYAVVGSVALAHHGRPRYTKDLDLLVQVAPGNAQRLMAALTEFGFGSVGLKKDDFLEVGAIIQLGYEPVRIDLMTSLLGVTWSEIADSRETMDFGGVLAPVIGREQFIKAKRASGRKSDLGDLERLGIE